MMRVRAFIALLLCAACLSAQQAPVFPTPAFFRHHFSTPKARVELRPPVRLRDFVVDGKLELSLRSFLELVMANNTDIAIQRLTIETPRNAIQRAFGAFDPNLVGTFNANRQKDAATSVLQGASLRNSLSQTADFTYQQTLETGTQYNIGFNGSKSSSNDVFATFNPALNATLRFNVTQPLLRNRGAYVTRLPVMVARSQLRKSEYDLRNTLMTLVSAAETVYWDVIAARERLRVQEKSLELANALLARSQRELELGAMSPLDIYRPQQNQASAEIQVSQARFTLTQTEDALRKQIGADLDPELRKAQLVLTETVLPGVDTGIADKETAVERALANRPDLRSSLQSLDVDNLNIQSATNQLRPDLSLTAGYQARGRGGTFYQRSNVFGGTSQLVTTVPGGFGDALDQLFGFGVPVYSFGLTLRLPLRDRTRTADLSNALVQKRMDALRARSLEQNIRLDVLNAITQVESSKASVRLATIARDFAQKQLDAEQKKYDLGTTVLYFVQEAQIQLTNADAALVTESVRYRRNQLNLLRMTGELLDERGVRVE